MFTGSEIVDELTAMSITDVVWVPDSVMGLWEPALESAPGIRLIRVCREGEAWPLAAGLMMGGRLPLVLMQTTGLFESGDAMRNVIYDMRIPVFSMIGGRNLLKHDSDDSARAYAEPILRAWEVDYELIASVADKPKFAKHFHHCRSAKRAGAVLLAE